jgi:hypothetical protein
LEWVVGKDWSNPDAPGPDHELAGVLLAGRHDRGDLIVGVVEHLAQQERRPLLR